MAWWSELAARRNTINLFSVHHWNSIKIWRYYRIFDFQSIFKFGRSYVEKSKIERKLRKKTVIWFFAKFENPDQIDHQIWHLMTNELISHRSLLTSETDLRFAQLHLGEDSPVSWCLLVEPGQPGLWRYYCTRLPIGVSPELSVQVVGCPTCHTQRTSRISARPDSMAGVSVKAF